MLGVLGLSVASVPLIILFQVCDSPFLTLGVSQPSTIASTPFENQLTETLVGICEHVPAFKRNFFEIILQNQFGLDNIKTEQMQISSQVNYEGKSIDIELFIENTDKNRLLTVFIEVKAWSGENYSQDLENKDKYVGQLESYYNILSKNAYSSFGEKVALVTLTPFLNKLEFTFGSDNKNFLKLEQTNFFWNEVGDLLKETLKNTKNEKELFLLTTFLEYLKEVNIMSDQTLNLQDLAVIDSYVKVKKKMWASLEATATYMKKELPKGGSRSSWATASTQEEWNDQFIAYQNIKSDFCVCAGYFFNEGNPWIGVWLEGKAGDPLVQKVREEVAKELGIEPQVYDDNFEDNDSWIMFKEKKDVRWFLLRTINLIEFVNSEHSVSEISAYFLKHVQEILNLKAIKKVVASLE